MIEMAKPEYADVEIRPHFNEHLTAWVDGKYLGVVHTDGDGVYVRLAGKVLSHAARKMRGIVSVEAMVEGDG